MAGGIPSGADPSGWDATTGQNPGSGYDSSALEGTITGAGLSALAGRTQANVTAQKQAEVTSNDVWTQLSKIVFAGLEPDGKTPLPLLLLQALGKALSIPMHLLEDAATAVENIAESIINAGAGIAQAITGIVDATVADVANWVNGLLSLLGMGHQSSGGSSPVLDQSTSIQQLLGLLDTSQPVPANLFKALTPTASKNLLTAPNFNNNPYNTIQGQGEWCWDGWIGRSADFGGQFGSVRTVRPGTIKIYNMVGTSQGIYILGNEPGISVANTGQIMAYLQSPEYSYLVDWVLRGVDPTYFEWVNVPYPATMYPEGSGVKAGADWLMNDIKQTAGKFFFVMDSQGNEVGAAVYDQIRYGSLQDRNDDFLGAIAVGNLRREAGHTFPGCPEPAPGTGGMCCTTPYKIGPYKSAGNVDNPAVGNLIDTEDKWWDFANPGDYFACTPYQGSTVVPPADGLGGNIGCIGGIQGRELRNFYNFIHQDYTGTNLVGALLDLFGPVMTQINNLGAITSPHNNYSKEKPLAFKGDDRTYFEIGLDYIKSFQHLVSPPVDGIRHQFLGQRFPVKDYQVVTAGAWACWTNVIAAGPAIMVCVNAYDVAGNLIATVTADQATLSDPPPESNWNWDQLKADFVMPPGAVEACIVLNVEPQAMRQGIVWFDDCEFEVTNLIDAAYLDIKNMPQISAAQVQGPQGIADMLTAMQNLIDSYASAATQTNQTGAQWADALQSVAQLALNANDALSLGVSHAQILSPSNQPIYNGLQPTGETTFPLSTFTGGSTLPQVSVAQGSTIIGFIRTQQAVKKGFIEFMAKGSGTPAGIYMNVYKVDTTSGTYTQVWSSPDLSAQVTSGVWSWVAINIPDASKIMVDSGELYAMEIVAQGSTLTVAAETLGVPNHPNVIPANVGAARQTAATGGVSPASLTNAQVNYGASCPYVIFGISDAAPNYQAPNTQSWKAAGTYKYSLPDWVIQGDILDATLLGAGGCGGEADGLFFLNAWLSGGLGQGGDHGAWATKSLVYGVDIPLGVKDLTLIVGDGGCAPGGTGSDTLLGYGFDNAPVPDAVGTGGKGSGATLTGQHNATEGAYVVVFVSTSFGTYDVKYAGRQMIPLGLVYNNPTGSGGAGGLYAFGLPKAPGGNSIITVTFPQAANATMASMSYNNVSSVGLVSNADGHTDTPTMDCHVGDKQFVVQAFSTYSLGQLDQFTGGTHRYWDAVSSGGKYYSGLSVSDSASSVEFAAKNSVVDYWGGISLVLNPAGTVLLQAPGGAGGGPGGKQYYNPLNTNTTNVGLSADKKVFQGRTWFGGPATNASHYPGNAPGGGSAGGDATANPMAGAPGGAFLVARQGNHASTIVSGGNGGGAQLPVVYEATGAGGSTTAAGPTKLQWQHVSDGGPHCGVVLIGAVDFNGGTCTVNCSYGSVSFTRTLDNDLYYNAGGYGVMLFAIGLIGPPSGPQTVTIDTLGSTATINQIAGVTVSYQNVGDFGDWSFQNGTAAAIACPAIESNSGEMVVAGFADMSAAFNNFSGATRWNQPNAASIPMLVGDAPGAESVALTVNAAASNQYGAVFGVIKPIS